MKQIPLTIFDETLRDGEQQVGIFFDAQTKIDLTQLIANTGIDHVALMPAIHPTEAELVKNLVDRNLPQIVASTMMGKSYIDQSQACGVKTIILFNAVSDRLLSLRDSSSPHSSNPDLSNITQIRNRMIDRVITHLKYAASRGLRICFAAEDASRADFDFLVECINKFQPYIEHFILCDTVGILTPEDTKLWLRNLIEFTGDRTPLSVHFHNDRGLALENTIQAVLAGARGVSGTFGGIGERAGNVALEQVLNGLKLRYDWHIEGINYDALREITEYLSSKGFRANAPYSTESLRYETGIHVDSLCSDRSSYYLFTQGQPEIWYGKFSGASNFQYLFEHCLNQPQPQSKYQEFRERIKHIAIAQKCSFSKTEVLKLLGY
ncbi:MAG: 2-isopropylmalate synthase [Pleurocapsa sp. SU_5_0]|nr:2-isopropylmalate synthase [Pleurocapsa sp. SU_5_0]